MENLRKLVVILLGICLSIVLSVSVLIYGWGLTPKSWFWILGIGFFGQLIAQALIALGKEP